MKKCAIVFMFFLVALSFAGNSQTVTSSRMSDTVFSSHGNPIFRHKFTADPAALVHDGKMYIFAGHDQAAPGHKGYVMHEWLCFSSKDLKTWTEHPVPLTPHIFSWAAGDAWAAQVVPYNGKFYWFVSTSHKDIHGKAIGVAVADRPEGPYHDALGKALITNDMTTEVKISWDDIDPTFSLDDNGDPWLFWGNTKCYYAKLKKNLVELDSDIKTIDLPHYTEAPWIHKRNGWYYLSYAYEFPEKTAYAMSRHLEGPWEYKGLLNELAGNCNTNHQSIVEFKGKWYFIYHNGALVPDFGSFHRSVCIDELQYNADGTMKRVIMTSEGVNGK